VPPSRRSQGPDAPINPPDHSEVTQRLNLLMHGERHRELVARWAQAWLDADVEFPTAAITRALVYMAAADLKTPKGEYLYAEPDFGAWAAELDWDRDERPRRASTRRPLRHE
jgi:hypothetical protein